MTTTTYTTPINRKKWNNLFYCKEGRKFSRLWNDGYGNGTRSQSSIEYTLCHYLWRKRLDESEIVRVFSAWWKKHGIRGNFFQLRHHTIPKTYAFVKPYLIIIEAKHRERKRVEQASRRARRKAERYRSDQQQDGIRHRVVEFAKDMGTLSARQIGTALNITAAAASKHLSRCSLFVKVSYGKYKLTGVAA